ncbi:MAG: hypothetical protein AAGG65_07245, partial [Pseudomonadota bacterium]
QGSNAARNEGTMLGCNALLQPEYTDFVMETWLSNNDNDGVGLNFGWKSLDDHFRVHKINDVWPTPLVDYVQMPHWKIRRRLTGRTCEGVMTDATNCYETVAFIDGESPRLFSVF